ncbi:MAG: hypothetical protein DRP08_05130 [Candidatus Aenigmatarchaeota archaeon]|nr:MAG: hypothetical protein DRP08_05130 [Candidatus Aenigmarchaeota archaeon]
MKPFVLVLARNKRFVDSKIQELERLGLDFLIICGERVEHPAVIFRKAIGKWDAINFGARFVPKKADIVVLNDVDTRIHNFWHSLSHLDDGADLVYCRVNVSQGPQVKFYRIADPIRKYFHIFASGELMLIRKKVFRRLLPIPPCVAEDSYMLFKVLELGYKAYFCTETYTITDRTVNVEEEEAYKARTTLGIYQVLRYVKPPPWIRIFYTLLPMIAPLLSLVGKEGLSWVKGIISAVKANMTKRYPTMF